MCVLKLLAKKEQDIADEKKRLEKEVSDTEKKAAKDKEKEINQYIDKNNISFKKSADLVKLVAYCRDLK